MTDKELTVQEHFLREILEYFRDPKGRSPHEQQIFERLSEIIESKGCEECYFGWTIIKENSRHHVEGFDHGISKCFNCERFETDDDAGKFATLQIAAMINMLRAAKSSIDEMESVRADAKETAAYRWKESFKEAIKNLFKM